MVNYCYENSPVGRLLIFGDEERLLGIDFVSGQDCRTPGADWVEAPAKLQQVRDELDAYFKGSLKRFTVPLGLDVTPFQAAVLGELQKVPYGETVSYGELARRVGNPKASRAVGMANAKNPIPIVIPCHRVIGSNGKLTGYGGGIGIKETLLDLERSFS